ncbi:A24 family peptidase [Novosphingobium mangrovi (ex Huang et al. 2023)]|uniref:Prepilin peptidase n=1 Tax=Novosphingobium mangrovi (ex Huang et al. 2023) TaxID=2976432 RepID=A0ABT2I531_9SPHN|nr:prepilin peptidase [Novosphingobium mangrovi (ex Huang et al. 2023)]MCT2399657.1 prepilin peptidase [Novosphingobium mangrovi (ex Huang et al. 2023)]
MSGGIFSYALLAGLATALLVAAFTDLRRREIDNWLNGAIALAAPLWWLSMGFDWVEIGFQIGLATATFVLTCLLFALRQMGGGDVKLLSALALWFTPVSFVQVVMLMAVIGGGASIGMAALNMKRVPGETLRDALALGAAAAWVWGACAIVFSMATRRPLMDSSTVEALFAVLPQAWILFAAVLIVILIFAYGFFHIVRRQKSRLPIPYGIAIAAAGLWVLGEQTLSAAWLAAQSG